MVFNVEWGDGEAYETFNPDKAKQKAKDKNGTVILTQDGMQDEQVYPDPYSFESIIGKKKKGKNKKSLEGSWGI